MADSDKTVNKYIGEQIRKYRTHKNITLEELAEYLKTTPQAISRYELGDRKTDNDTLFKLAEYFNVSINDFFPPLEYNAKNKFENQNQFNELEILFDNNKDILTEDDKETIKFLIEKRKREIDKQLGDDKE